MVTAQRHGSTHICKESSTCEGDITTMTLEGPIYRGSEIVLSQHMCGDYVLPDALLPKESCVKNIHDPRTLIRQRQAVRLTTVTIIP